MQGGPGGSCEDRGLSGLFPGAGLSGSGGRCPREEGGGGRPPVCAGGLQGEDRPRQGARDRRQTPPGHGRRDPQRRQIYLYQFLCGPGQHEDRQQARRHAGQAVDPAGRRRRAPGYPRHPLAQVRRSGHRHAPGPGRRHPGRGPGPPGAGPVASALSGGGISRPGHHEQNRHLAEDSIPVRVPDAGTVPDRVILSGDIFHFQGRNLLPADIDQVV